VGILLKHQYEKKTLITFILLIVLLLEVLGIIFLYTKKTIEYQTITAIVSNEDIGIALVTKEERKILYQNKKIMINGKKETYQIKEDKGIVLKRNSKNYYELWIKTKIPKDKKTMDSIDFSIIVKKIRWIELIKKIWEGDER